MTAVPASAWTAAIDVRDEHGTYLGRLWLRVDPDRPTFPLWQVWLLGVGEDNAPAVASEEHRYTRRMMWRRHSMRTGTEAGGTLEYGREYVVADEALVCHDGFEPAFPREDPLRAEIERDALEIHRRTVIGGRVPA
jgi:hypothetical protein